ncbi:CBS domain-containing protein [Streptomyces sp. CNQ085]|uniref:CBS domain-containing protein n=1 Tax=Streptomyces sp. CNQ085 TaxID=2886944 RepID=UPI001F5064D6|nr:CBS domain-containing protein [Streptomyces sp. CNQ085]MCI0383086.1 CBS domain-containing protein [Streptomyces sp. CNQ085]
MTTARDIMHTGAECVGEHETPDAAARRMRDLDVGALPTCGDDDKLRGIVTDRDIVVKCLATGGDPSRMTAGADAQKVPDTMEKHQVRRVPITGGEKQLAGMVSEADLARSPPEAEVGRFLEAVVTERL